MNIDVKINPTYLPYFNKPHFLQIFYGGSSSGKSFFLTDKIVVDTLNGVNWLCCRNVGKTIRNSVFNEITKSINNMGVRKYFSINKSDMVITCKVNDKQILFCGLDDPEKVKSITPINGVLESIFIEEATEIKRDAYMQLKKRLRGRSKHKKHIFMAFNPILRSHWIYKEFFKEWQDDKTCYESNNYGATETKKGFGLLILKTTYKDNIFLTDEDRALLEDESDPYFYNVYTLGNWGVLGNVIFKNWRVEDLSKQIPHFDNLHYGLDVGYTNPNAFIKVHLDKENKKIYIVDEYYRAGMQDEDLYYTAKEFVKSGYIMVDNAANQTIDYLASKRILAVPTKKGGDSVNRGIRFLWGYEIIIDIRCQNFKNEIEQYHWQEDKNGVVLEKPVKQNDHLMDALRYALENEMLQAEATAGKR